MTKQHIAGLDGLRGIAALVVLAHHMELKSTYDTQWMLHGYLAVDLFFMLSGFVIAHAYEPKLANGLGLRKYGQIRLVRLYPVIALGALAGFAVTMAAVAAESAVLPWLALLIQLLFIPALWRSGSPYPFNGAQWSLFFELFVNLSHAVAAPLLTKRVLAGVVAVSGVALFVTAYNYGSLSVGFERSNFAGGFVRAIFGFFSGVLMFRLWSVRPGSRFSAHWPLLLLALPVVVVLAGHDRLSWRWYLDPLLVAAVFPVLIWTAASVTLRGPVAKAALFLGVISYPCYALQWPVRQAGAILLADRGLPEPLELTLLALAVLLVSWLTARFYDEPAREALRGMLVRLGPKAASTP